MSRTDLDVDKVFLTKNLDSIKRRHDRAEELYENVRILQDATDKNLFIVPSFSHIGGIYKVKRLTLSTRHRCEFYCEVCEACVHAYKCDCPDGVKSNFCKHMHVVSLNYSPSDPAENNQDIDESNNMVTDYDNKKKDIRNLKRGRGKKSLHDEAKATVVGLVTELDQFSSVESFKTIIETIKALKTKIKAIEEKEQETNEMDLSSLIDPCA